MQLIGPSAAHGRSTDAWLRPGIKASRGLGCSTTLAGPVEVQLKVSLSRLGEVAENRLDDAALVTVSGLLNKGSAVTVQFG